MSSITNITSQATSTHERKEPLELKGEDRIGLIISEALRPQSADPSMRKTLNRMLCGGKDHPNWELPIVQQHMYQLGIWDRKDIPHGYFKTAFPHLSLKDALNFAKGTPDQDITKKEIGDFYNIPEERVSDEILKKTNNHEELQSKIEPYSPPTRDNNNQIKKGNYDFSNHK